MLGRGARKMEGEGSVKIFVFYFQSFAVFSLLVCFRSSVEHILKSRVSALSFCEICLLIITHCINANIMQLDIHKIVIHNIEY